MNTRSNTTAPVVPATVECPILPLAVRFGSAYRRGRELDEKKTAASRVSKVGFPINYLEAAEAHSYDEELVLRDLISSTAATSLEGAAVQIVEAICRVDAIFDALSERDDEARKNHRAADRLLYSALRVLVQHCGRTPNEIVGTEFETRNCDPWTLVEERIADVQRHSDEEASQ